MREVRLNKTGSLKTRYLSAELYLSDLETSMKSFAPGEWVRFYNSKKGDSFAGFVNPMAGPGAPCAYAVKKLTDGQAYSSWEMVDAFIEKAVAKRDLVSDYGFNARMVYGPSDRLPGLIVDSFENAALAQINTAGLDVFRDRIKVKLEALLKREVILLDNPSYRMAEGLPVFENSHSLKTLKIKEGDLSFEVPFENMQKVGFYYDHRENRRKLRDYLSRLKLDKKRSALDLFCYSGAWGFSMASAGVKSVEFVDQGDFEQSIQRGWRDNNLEGSFSFTRSDVFKRLKDLKNENASFDIIVSDPPAFCKSPKGAKKALEGYSKLHRGCFRLLGDKSFFAACSCTHYVDMNAFLQNVASAAAAEGKEVTMLDLGTQGFDHPSKGFKDKSNYLKYVLFYVEKL